MNLYRWLVRPIIDVLSGFDRERAHYRAIFFLRLCGLWPLRRILFRFLFVQNERTVFGITFPNPIGAAAGFDKRGVALRGIEAFGFGFVEIGTVTPLPQPGNPRPRLFRLSEDDAIINRMGFNNEGVNVLAKRLASYSSLRIPIGANIGKGRDTPLESASADYEACIRALYPYVDYFTINISSPNTKDLRRLQEKDRLQELLDNVRNTAKECAKGGTPKPILLKIAPDLSFDELDDVIEVAGPRVEGLIVSNTTISRPELLSVHRTETGGLSGRPVQGLALELVRYIHKKLPSMPVIGVGGIFSPEDAARMFEAGASLIQLYSGLVFEGPLLAHRINRVLKERGLK